MSDQDTTITADALEQMLDQFDGSVNLRLLAASFLDQVQQFEDDIWPLLAERSLALATGHRLDGLGQIADLNRSGRNDADYRLALTAEFAVLQSNGTAEELIAIAQLMVQMGTADYEVIEYYPKTVVIRPVDHPIIPVVLGEWFYDSGVAAGDTYIRLDDPADPTFDVFIGENDADAVDRSAALAALVPGDGIRVVLDSGEFFDFTISTAVGDVGAAYEFACWHPVESASFAWPVDDTRVSVHTLDGTIPDLATLTGTQLKRAASAATSMHFIYSFYDDANTFTLSGQGAAIETSTALGLASIIGLTGGHLSGNA